MDIANLEFGSANLEFGPANLEFGPANPDLSPANLELSRIWSFQKWSFRPANLELESDSRKSGVDSRFGFWPKTRFGVGVDLTPENLEFWNFEKMEFWSSESGVGVWV